MESVYRLVLKKIVPNIDSTSPTTFLMMFAEYADELLTKSCQMTLSSELAGIMCTLVAILFAMWYKLNQDTSPDLDMLEFLRECKFQKRFDNNPTSFSVN